MVWRSMWRKTGKFFRGRTGRNFAVGSAAIAAAAHRGTSTRFNPKKRKRGPGGLEKFGKKLKIGKDQKFRTRGGNSVTNTKMKTDLQGTSQHNDTSSKRFRVVLNKPWYKSKFGTAFRFTETWDGVFTTKEGKQDIAFLRVFGNRSQLQGGTPTTLRADPQLSFVNFYELNPYRANGGSTLFPAGSAATVAANDMIFYRSVYGKVAMINLTNLATQVKIYWFLCKKDTAKSPDTIWIDGLNAMAMGLAAAPDVMSTTVAVNTPGLPSYDDLGQSPFNVKEFKQFYKPVHSETVILQGGDQRDVNFRFEINRLIKKQAILDRASAFLAGLTVVPFAIIKGSLVAVGDTGGATEGSEVTVGKTKVGFMCTNTHVFYPVPAENKTPTTVTYNGVVSSLVGHIVDEEMVIDTDVISKVLKA